METTIVVAVTIKASTPQEAYNVLTAALGAIEDGNITLDEGDRTNADWETLGYATDQDLSVNFAGSWVSPGEAMSLYAFEALRSVDELFPTETEAFPAECA